MFNKVINLNSKLTGKVKLRSSNPVIEINHLSEEEDLENLIKYVEDYVPVVNSPNYRTVGGDTAFPKQIVICLLLEVQIIGGATCLV